MTLLSPPRCSLQAYSPAFPTLVQTMLLLAEIFPGVLEAVCSCTQSQQQRWQASCHVVVDHVTSSVVLFVSVTPGWVARPSRAGMIVSGLGLC